jgi:hypothetical protein
VPALAGHADRGYVQHNLVSDIPGLAPIFSGARTLNRYAGASPVIDTTASYMAACRMAKLRVG